MGPGIAYHNNRSCKLTYLLNAEVSSGVSKETGVPFVRFDGDQTDPRNFSPAQFDIRVEALAEMMANLKERGEDK